MAILSITKQPIQDSLMAAMQPILVAAETTVNTPMVFCDVYINSVYYGTYEHTAPLERTTTVWRWVFDIQDKVREVFTKILPASNRGDNISQGETSCRVMCKLRDSTYVNNVLQEEQPIPIQATPSKPAVPGGGTSTNSFWVLLATVQLESVQVFEQHLTTLKVGEWDPECYPLSHRLNGYQVVPGYSDYFPFTIKRMVQWGSLTLHYRNRLRVSWDSQVYNFPPPPTNCLATITGLTININIAQSQATFNVVMLNATAFVWSIPQINGGALNGPVNGTSVTTPTLPAGSYVVTIFPRCSNGINGAPINASFQITGRLVYWRGRFSDGFCEQLNGSNTGRFVFQTLEQVYSDNGTLTGQTKPNAPTDSDYAPPFFTQAICPIPPPVGSGRMVMIALGNTRLEACSANTTVAYISPAFNDVDTGAIIFQDAALTNEFIGYAFVRRASDSFVFFLNQTTAQVGNLNGTC